MAMSVQGSITAEGWQAIYDTLEKWSTEELIAAIVSAESFLYDDEQEPEHAALVDYETARQAYYRQYATHDALVFRAYELIEETDTCSNDCEEFYIDTHGYFTVSI